MLKSKMEIRSSLLGIRKNLSTKHTEQYSKVIKDKLLNNQYFRKAKNIWIFAPLSWEPNLLSLIYNKEKCFYFPKVEKSQINFYLANDLDQLEKWTFWIPEPRNWLKLVENMDLILVPWIAFTKNWKRIGFWKGYYDKYLKKNATYKIWICFDFQIQDNLYQDTWDELMDEVITN